MKYPCRKSTIVGAAFSLLFVAGCGGGGTEEEDTPEAAAFRFRDAVMEVIEGKMLTIRAMELGDSPVDEAVFAKSVADLQVMAGMVTEGFMLEGISANSRAIPEIWSDWDDFNQKAANLQSAVDTLAEAVADGGFEAGQDLVQSTAENCSGCHRPYRGREDGEE